VDGGYPAQVEQARIRGESWSRVVVRGFADQQAAKAFARRIQAAGTARGARVIAPAS